MKTPPEGPVQPATGTTGNTVSGHPPDVPDDYVEIAGYVSSFKDSSDRSRRIVFILVTVCVLISIANWNLHKASWARVRMRKAAELRTMGKFPAMNDSAKAVAGAKPTDEQRQLAYNELVVSRYPEEFVKQMLVIHIPAVGISIDVNDIGILGGVTMALLMLVLLLALMRQHQNLYLSSFKIRRLHERAKHVSDGESRANYLYHSLVMTQVLTAPPTLTYWPVRGRRRWLTTIVKLLFLLPAVIQMYVVWTNWYSPIVKFYDIAPRPKLIVQDILALLLIILGVLCWIYARAMDRRWRDVFFYINPHLTAKEPDPWLVRVKMRSRWSAHEKYLRKALESALLAGRGRIEPRHSGLPSVTLKLMVRAELLSTRKVDVVSHQLVKAARRSALERAKDTDTHYVQLEGYELDPLPATTPRIEVSIRWWFSTAPANHA